MAKSASHADKSNANAQGGWLNNILGEPAGTVADRNRLALIDQAHAARIASQSELDDFQRNLPTDMNLRRPVSGFVSPGLLAFGLNIPGAEQPVTAKLDGHAQINVTLDATPGLLQLFNASVQTSTTGDVKPNTGGSMTESTPDRGMSGGYR